MKRWTNNMRLSILFSLVVLLIFIITGLIMFGIAMILLNSGLVDRLGWRNAFPIMLALLPASAIVGTFVALVFGRYPLKPLQQMIDAINKLAAGDFSARVQMKHPPQFRELGDSFNRMAQEMGGIEMLRSDFVNNFSHEFKTPIVSIKGFAELLKADNPPSPEREEYLDIIIRESTRLSSMATNVLNLSRIENQAIVTHPEPLDLTELIRRCVLMMQTAWESRGIDMDVDLEEVTINGSEELLSQVWLNLLDNAVKFSPPGGRVQVRLARRERQAVASVRNEGAGIPPEDVERVFDKFYHTDLGGAAPGNGLGLTLARKIARLHGGDVTCVSHPGEGAEFTVTLPLN